MKVVALHGDFARGKHLREDMGDPHWVDWFPDWQDDREATLERLRAEDSLALLAFSSSCGWVSELSTVLGERIKSAVLYEGPIWCQPHGSFPVVIAWNDDSFGLWSDRAKMSRRPVIRRRRRMADEAYQAWTARGRLVVPAKGKGRHLRPIERPETWNFAHNWDQSLNPAFERFVMENRGGLF